MEEVIKFVDKNFGELSLVVLLLLKVLLNKLGVDFTKILAYVPLIADLIEFLKQEAEKYQLYRFRQEVEKVAPYIYVLVENASKVSGKKGQEKLADFVKEISSVIKVDDVQKVKIIHQVVEKLNTIQNNYSFAQRIFNEVKQNFPIFSFLANLILKLIK